jgi:hypothetical protein
MSAHEGVRGSAASHHSALLIQRITTIRNALTVAWSVRRERLWTALVAIPLAELATALVGMWWLWPALLGIAWACTRSWRWFWVLSLELGFVGATWAEIGVSALAHFPDDQLLVGAIWAALPLPLAAAGAMNRQRYSRPEAYFPLR